MERRRAIAWAGSVSLTACVGALALGSFVGGFGFDAPQSSPSPHAAPQVPEPQVPEPQVPEPQVPELQVPEPQVPESPAGPELMPQVPQRRPSSGNAHKAPQRESVAAAAPTAVPVPVPVATPHVDNYPRALAGHRKAGAAVPVPPPDAKPARDIALRDVAWMDVLTKDRRFSWARDVLAVLRDIKRSTARSSGTHAGSGEHHVSDQDDGHDD
ncbi:MAG TPA: hypothetical protein VJ757_12255 [Pseudonocardiaceae bacterium]|nr:hypothetical protein [Pseudonocardiaceae bacterium]